MKAAVVVVALFDVSYCDPDCPVQTPNRGLQSEMGKNGRKMDFDPTRKKGKKWPKNGKIRSKMGQKWPFSLFLTILSPFSGGTKIHFLAFFPI